ncbi:MAG: glycosyltransferase family 4 protein [Lentimicrobiaceae bacterium]|jgi:UDP-glucose:(heptosyl)LPS alpha-1,3-glucosyltransferase|nr:glycosyltransferase family 4 protein [Lentimicrobiaceae bacterium]
MKINMGDKKLRIAVLIRNYSASGGGAERYCVELTNRLSKLHEVHVFSQHNSESSKSITFHQIPQWFKKPRYVNQLLFSYLTKRDTQGKFDIVHSHDMVTHANIYTLHVPCVRTKWTQSKGIRKVLRWANTLLSPRKMAYLWLENKEMQVLPNRHFISVSEYLSRNILESYPRLDGHMTIAHPGIDIQPRDEKKITKLRQQFREDYNIPKSAFVLLFVAHGFKRKGLPAIIKALEILNNKDIHVVVAGSGNPKEIQINSPVVQDNTHFIGVVKNMSKLYPVTDTLIHPTLGDTYGMVVLEAMSHKLPVIVSSAKYCGFSEHLSSEEAIILDNPRSSKEISKNIELLNNQPELHNKISENGSKKSKKISWNSALKVTIQAYKQIDSR